MAECAQRSVTEADGAPVSPSSTTELYNLRAGRLLISPFVASE